MPDYRGKFISRISEDRSFLENWSEMRGLELLYIPIGDGSYLAVDPGNKEELFDFIDVASTTSPDGLEVAFLVTDPSLVPVELALARLPACETLLRLFKNPGLEGIVFNPPIADALVATDQGFTIFAHALPRLVGLLESDDHLAQRGQHLDYAGQFLSEDQICQAMYHSSQARDEGQSLDRCFILEASSLLRLGLVEQADSYLTWYLRKGKRSLASDLVAAQLTLIQGQAEDALFALKGLCSDDKFVDEIIQIEKARCLFQLNRFDQAYETFALIFEKNSKSVEAQLGMGVVSRAQHYSSLNQAGLEQALAHFQFVAKHGHFHRPEGLHHLGTVLSALERWEEAEKAYRETLLLSPSPVSKRNLCLVLHALDKMDQGSLHYHFLLEHFPEHTAGLEQYYETKSRSVIVRENPQSVEDLEALVVAARSSLQHNHDFGFQNNLLDFKRFDEYINYHAPGGMFLDGSGLYALDWHEIEQVLHAVSLHLADILVSRNLAHWELGSSNSLDEVFIQMQSSGERVSMLGSLLRKTHSGAVNDNLTNLEALVATTPGYGKICAEYSPLFQYRPASLSSCVEYREMAEETISTLRKAGFLLCDDLSDLSMLDAAISSLRDPLGPLQEQSSDEEQVTKLLQGIGFYFGILVQRYAGGIWFDHHENLGLSIRESRLSDIYPLWIVYRRAEMGNLPNMFETLASFQSPLVCANLARRVESHEIATRQELSNLLAEHLPKILNEDPTGDSLVRMADMIALQALGKVLD